MRCIAEDVWLWQRPFKVMGASIGRNMTAIRLQDGALLLHSPFPLKMQERAELEQLGNVAYLFEATCLHDTFSAEARGAWPDARYLGPKGFKKSSPVPVEEIDRRVPETWMGILEVGPLEGLRKGNETVLLHRPSQTLIVGDLIFNISNPENLWTRAFLRMNGKGREPGPTLLFSSLIHDEEAFRKSLREVTRWEFDRLIPCHGEPIETGAKETLREAFNL